MLKQLNRWSLILNLFLLGIVYPEITQAQLFGLFSDGPYLPGVIILKNNDTIRCDIMVGTEAQNCSFVRFKDKNTNQKITYEPYSVIQYKVGVNVYHSLPRAGFLGAVEYVFMIPKIIGQVSLYKYYFTKQTQYGYLEDSRFYLYKKNSMAIDVRKLDFAKKISTYIKDCDLLSVQVRDKLLKYDDLSGIIQEYNKWYEQRSKEKLVNQAESLITEKDHISTLSDTSIIVSNPKKLSQLELQSSSIAIENNLDSVDLSIKYPRVGFDIPVFISRTYVDVPSQLDDIFTYYKGGGGYDIGAGIRIDFSEYSNLKVGLNSWNRRLNINYKATAHNGIGNQINVLVKERGQFRYFGGYIKYHYNIGGLFAGAGFNFSFNNRYKCNYDIYTLANNVFLDSQENRKSSPLVDSEINGQFDIILTAGFRFSISENTRIKPAVDFSLGTKPAIKTGAYEISPIDGRQNDLDIYTLSLKFGIIIEFGVK